MSKRGHKGGKGAELSGSGSACLQREPVLTLTPQLTGGYLGEPLLPSVPRFEASLWAGAPLPPAGPTEVGQLRAGFKLPYSGAPDLRGGQGAEQEGVSVGLGRPLTARDVGG